MSGEIFHSTKQWLDKNADSFCPPVGNLLMHSKGQLDVMFVAGPNQRKDFHVQQSEEFFYQRKGDMTLKIIEQNQHKDILIKEGQIFLLPAAIPHSPQRAAGSMGIVLERTRKAHEIDLLCFYEEENNNNPSLRLLYQTSGHWSQLSTNMAAAFERFYESENYKTGKSESKYDYPFGLNSQLVEDPVDLWQWIETNQQVISEMGRVAVFDRIAYAFKIYVCGEGNIVSKYEDADTWILQLKGNSVVEIENKCYNLSPDDSILVRQSKRYTITQEKGCYALMCTQENVPWKPQAKIYST